MAQGHVQLGTSLDAMREYSIEVRRYRKLQVNPYSAKLGTGGDDYDDLSPWAYHVEKDWQLGVGRKGEGDGGVGFSTADTRVPSQINLPQRVLQEDTRQADSSWTDARNMGTRAATGVVIWGQPPDGSATTIARGWWKTPVPPAGDARTAFYVSVYGRVGGTGTLWLGIMGEGGSPISYTTIPATSDDDGVGFRWYTAGPFNLTSLGFSFAESYFNIYLGLTGDSFFEFPATAVPTSGLVVVETPGYGTSSSSDCPIFVTNTYTLGVDTTVQAVAPIRNPHSSSLVSFHENRIYSRNPSTGVWSSATWSGSLGTPNAFGRLTTWGTSVMVGNNATQEALYIVAGTATVNGTYAAYLWEKLNGYLYRVDFQYNLHYSADGSTWTGPIPIAANREWVRGIAGVGQTLYIATDYALYYLSPYGSFIKGAMKWNTKRDGNGLGMCSFNGALYAIADDGIVQMAVNEGSISAMNIWAMRDDDTLSDFIGKPVALCATNSWLCVATMDSTTGATHVWAWNGQGWHYLASWPLPWCDNLAYDTTQNRLQCWSRTGVCFFTRLPDTAINPVNDTFSVYHPSAWVQTPWISGNLFDVDKDFESVYLSGDELSSGQTATVFWKVRGGTWQELGTISSDGGELRWSDYTTRPSGKEIKIGLRLMTTSLTATPTIDAIRLKHRPNVGDRWQWSLVLPIHDNQEMLDGDINPYDTDEIKDHLESLVRQVKPFYFRDVDRKIYETVVTGYDLNLDKYEWYDNQEHPYYMAQATLEQSVDTEVSLPDILPTAGEGE